MMRAHWMNSCYRRELLGTAFHGTGNIKEEKKDVSGERERGTRAQYLCGNHKWLLRTTESHGWPQGPTLGHTLLIHCGSHLIWAFISTLLGMNVVQNNTVKLEVNDLHKFLKYELQGQQPLIKFKKVYGF